MATLTKTLTTYYIDTLTKLKFANQPLLARLLVRLLHLFLPLLLLLRGQVVQSMLPLILLTLLLILQPLLSLLPGKIKQIFIKSTYYLNQYSGAYKTDERILKPLITNNTTCINPNDTLKLCIFVKPERQPA